MFKKSETIYKEITHCSLDTSDIICIKLLFETTKNDLVLHIFICN